VQPPSARARLLRVRHGFPLWHRRRTPSPRRWPGLAWLGRRGADVSRDGGRSCF
jgi:hypothetical protein